jgi:hypothetical protein
VAGAATPIECFAMLITWDAVSALAGLFSTLAVLAAVIVAVRQVRIGAQQVDHLRRATQLEGTMKIFDLLNSREQQHARRFINVELEELLKDPAFRADVVLAGMAEDPEKHPEMNALRLMEMIGVYVKYDLLEADIVFDYWIPAVIDSWERLESLGVIAMQRQTWGPDLWENFEDLYHRGKAWSTKHSSSPKKFTPPVKVSANPS